MPRINILKTTTYCDYCGEELPDTRKNPYCAFTFEGGHKILEVKMHQKCAVQFYEELKSVLVENKFIEE